MRRLSKSPIQVDRVLYALMRAPWGKIAIASSPRGVLDIRTNFAGERAYLHYLRQAFLPTPEPDPEFLRPVIDQLQAYFSGTLNKFSCRLDIQGGTPFQQTVWKKLTTIPSGQTRSYRWLAEAVGHPGAFRAVGNANGRNPIPILIPCHRIVNSDGRLGGYTGGLHIKRWLLDRERF